MKVKRDLLAALAGALLAAVLSGTAVAGDSRSYVPHVVAGKGEECVEPTPVMRRSHMDFILHQRDETVHKGIRTKQYSLKECIECHVQTDEQGAYVPVNAPGQFCSSCHEYASVRMDCFQCHATTPAAD